MRQLCVRVPEFLGCYTLPYEVGSGKGELKLEGGLFKVFAPIPAGSEQKRLYRPLA